jgi:succinate dehydrogenase flavin-adding protein (antitoxin of CptAB toxin-antitoxin module)
MIEIDRLDFFEGYIKNHRDHIIKDLTSLDSKDNEILKLINEARLSEMDHLLDVIEDINKKTVDKK